MKLKNYYNQTTITLWSDVWLRCSSRTQQDLQIIYDSYIDFLFFEAIKTMENWHEQKLSNLPFCRKLNSRSKPNPTSNPTSNPLIPMIHVGTCSQQQGSQQGWTDMSSMASWYSCSLLRYSIRIASRVPTPGWCWFRTERKEWPLELMEASPRSSARA